MKNHSNPNVYTGFMDRILSFKAAVSNHSTECHVDGEVLKGFRAKVAEAVLCSSSNVMKQLLNVLSAPFNTYKYTSLPILFAVTYSTSLRISEDAVFTKLEDCYYCIRRAFPIIKSIRQSWTMHLRKYLKFGFINLIISKFSKSRNSYLCTKGYKGVSIWFENAAPRADTSKMKWSLEGRTQQGPRAIISFETSSEVFIWRRLSSPWAMMVLKKFYKPRRYLLRLDSSLTADVIVIFTSSKR